MMQIDLLCIPNNAKIGETAREFNIELELLSLALCLSLLVETLSSFDVSNYHSYRSGTWQCF